MSWRRPPSSGWSGISIKNSGNWSHGRRSDVIEQDTDLEGDFNTKIAECAVAIAPQSKRCAELLPV